MKIEFFHDVICSFCFPMSHRMREIQKRYPNVEIIHRSFSLEGVTSDSINRKDISITASKNGLLTAKTVQLMGSKDAYWNLFDAIQEKAILENKNIESLDVIKEAVLESNLNWDRFFSVFKQKETLEAVKKDLLLAQSYGIHDIPFLVINGKHTVNSTQSIETIEEAIETIAEQEHEALVLVEDDNYCYLDKKGTWVCE